MTEPSATPCYCASVQRLASGPAAAELLEPGSIGHGERIRCGACCDACG